MGRAVARPTSILAGERRRADGRLAIARNHEDSMPRGRPAERRFEARFDLPMAFGTYSAERREGGCRLVGLGSNSKLIFRNKISKFCSQTII